MDTRRAATWGVAMVVLVGAGAITYAQLRPDVSRGPQPIMQVQLIDASTLLVTSPSCHGEPDVTVSETTVAVSLSLVATVSQPGPACADTVEVALAEPLGERLVLDARGDVVVEVIEP